MAAESAAAIFDVDAVPRDTVLAMLRTEDRWRCVAGRGGPPAGAAAYAFFLAVHSKSDEMQALYDKTRHLLSDQVERYIQRNVLKCGSGQKENHRDSLTHLSRAFGFAPSVANLSRFWQIRSRYETDAEIMGSVIYLRYAHLLHDCTIPLGAPAPDASLVTLDESRPTSLSAYWTQHPQLVVMAGSMT